MIAFIVGLFVGAAIGMLVSALCVVAKRSDDER
ncbi:DUF3789 domain-containing protein [Dialister hominis]